MSNPVTKRRARGQQLTLPAAVEVLVIATILVVAMLYLQMHFERIVGSSAATGVVLTISWFAAALFAAVCHELGHAVVGRMMGRKVFLFAIWPIAIRRLVDGRHTLKYWGGTKGAFGMVIAIGPAGVHTVWRDVLFFVAGPAANLFTAVAAFLALGAIDFGPLTSMVLVVVAILSFVVGFLNLMPVAMSPGASLGRDGKQIFDRLLGRTTTRDLAIVELHRLTFMGVRPRDWPSEIIVRLDGVEDASQASVVSDWYRHEFALDRGDVAAAGLWADRLISRLDSLGQEWIDLLAATLVFFVAFYRGDAEAAESLLAKRVRDPSPNPAFSIGARAAISLARGDRRAALVLAEEAVAACDRDRGLLTADARDRLDEVRRAAMQMT